MRWEQLFRDLDSRFEEQEEVAARAQLADQQRHAAGTIAAAQRYLGAIGAELHLRLRSGRAVRGVLREVGVDWLLVATAAGELLVAMRAVTVVSGLTRETGAPLSAVAERFTLRMALRGIARDRAPVVLGLVGVTPDGTELAGTIDRIGADFVEVAQHAAFEPRRVGAVRSVALVPIAVIDTVQAHPLG